MQKYKKSLFDVNILTNTSEDLSTLELLAPAKNYEQGKAAIDHGADAVYIGAPSFGARVAANNSIEDIERLAKYAHLFHSKVFVTVNTLLHDKEVEEAVALCHQLYDCGCDALILQDLGLLECDLPPIELHASTQTHNLDPQRIKFMEQVGFKRVILARECSLEQMRSIREQTTVELEAFVQGALCVSYSGQCYLSQYLNQRSGNRGCCSQPCRSAYDLYNADGKELIHNEHLLSLKDFSAAEHIGSMIDAGITSFKIEGRLKDLSYVKNVTAYYRQLLDNMMSKHKGYEAASSGHCTFYFTPDLEKTFNRGFTDYFLNGRHNIASHATQKSLGKYLGTVISNASNSLTIKTSEQIHTGDGLCFFDDEGLDGFLVNQVDGNRVVPNNMPRISIGTKIWRNHDHLFEKALQGVSGSRKIDVTLMLSANEDKIQLEIEDADGCRATATMDHAATPAVHAEKAREQIVRQLSKLGDTPFTATHIIDNTPTPLFIPAAVINELRRKATERLISIRIQHFAQKPTPYTPNNSPYFEKDLDYRANVLNEKCRQFYERHGSCVKEWGVERSLDYRSKALMTTKYCLRYELGQCLRCKNNKTIDPDYRSDLYLHNNGRRFLLRFDCQRCEMSLTADMNG